MSDAPDTPELTPRTCSRCGQRYVWPKGGRRPNGECPRCQPELPLGLDTPAQPAPLEPVPERPPRIDDPGPQPDPADALCAERCGRPADGNWDGVPLCIGCADDALQEHGGHGRPLGALLRQEDAATVLRPRRGPYQPTADDFAEMRRRLGVA